MQSLAEGDSSPPMDSTNNHCPQPCSLSNFPSLLGLNEHNLGMLRMMLQMIVIGVLAMNFKACDGIMQIGLSALITSEA